MLQFALKFTVKAFLRIIKSHRDDFICYSTTLFLKRFETLIDEFSSGSRVRVM